MDSSLEDAPDLGFQSTFENLQESYIIAWPLVLLRQALKT